MRIWVYRGGEKSLFCPRIRESPKKAVDRGAAALVELGGTEPWSISAEWSNGDVHYSAHFDGEELVTSR